MCLYDGSNKFNFYLSDYSSITELYTDLFNVIIQEKYNNHNIFIHNGTSFDLVFIMKYLCNLPNINIDLIYKDNKFINVKITFARIIQIDKIIIKINL